MRELGYHPATPTSTEVFGAFTVAALRVQATEDCEPDRMACWVGSDVVSHTMGIYTDVAGMPGELIGVTVGANSSLSPRYQYQDLVNPVSPGDPIELVEGEFYWFVYQCSGGMPMGYDPDGSRTVHYTGAHAYSVGTLIEEFGTPAGSLGNYKFAMFVEYPTSDLATTYTLTAQSATGFPGEESADFTLSPDGISSATVTITPSGGGLSTPFTVQFDGTDAAQTFTITPTLAGTVTLTPTNNGGLTNPSAYSYRVASKARGFVWDGDSLGTDFGRPGTRDTSDFLADVTRWNTVGYHNVAVPGQTAAQALADLATQVLPLIEDLDDDDYVKVYAIIQVGINDVSAGETAQTVYNRIIACHTAAAVSGKRTIGFTLTKVQAFSGAQETVRQAVNTMLRANHVGMTFLIDLDADSYFDDTSDTDVYQDGIHYTEATSEYIADLIVAAEDIVEGPYRVEAATVYVPGAERATIAQ